MAAASPFPSAPSKPPVLSAFLSVLWLARTLCFPTRGLRLYRRPFSVSPVLRKCTSEHRSSFLDLPVLRGGASEHRSPFLDLPVLREGAFEHGAPFSAASVLR